MVIVNKTTQKIIKEDDNSDEGFSFVFFTAILTKDKQDKYAVYVGIGSDAFLLGYGTKQTHKEALQYFPMIAETEYRR